jgi:uncharacterized protein YbjT (DUF2867 family)
VILVTGATGNVGAELVRILVAAGEPVRALIRRDSDRSRVPPGAEAVVGDLNRPDMPQFLAEGRRAGVEHVVLQSSSAVPGGDMSNAVARYHILSEAAVRESGLAWTFLQPSSFMSNTLQWVPQLRAGDVVRAPFPDVRVATIDPYDVAAVSAAALTSRAHDGQSYRVSGPDSLLPADRVRVLGEVLGRDLRFEGQSDAEARLEMLGSMPPEYVDAFFSFFADGKLDESPVFDSVARVTGSEPRSFEQWAVAHADAFR